MEDIDAPNASQVPTFERRTGFCGSAGGSLRAVPGFLEPKTALENHRRLRLGAGGARCPIGTFTSLSIVTGTKYLN